MSYVICGARYWWCECILPDGHDGLHACDDRCGGQWAVDDQGHNVPAALPSGQPSRPLDLSGER